MITYIDRHHSSYRVDYDGRRLVAAEVWQARIDWGSLLEASTPEFVVGPIEELDATDPVRAASAWYRMRL